MPVQGNRGGAAGPPVVTVVVVTWQAVDLLAECLDSLAGQTLAHEVIVVDNASTDGTAEFLSGRPTVHVVHNRTNRGFAGGVADGLREVRTPYAALLNNDAVAEPGWLAALTAELEAHPEAAAVTSRMLLAGVTPPTINNAGVDLRDDGYGADRGLGEPSGNYDEPAEVFGFSGGAALVRMDALRQVGGFPERFFLYYEDTDTSWRLRRAGWSIRYAPGAVVHHRHAASSDPGSRRFAYVTERNRLLMHVRCAPLRRAAVVWWRFLLTTGSLAARRLTGSPRPPAYQQRLGLRLHVLAGALRLLPWALRTRS